MDGLDYSWGRPDLDRVVEEGYRFVIRYIGDDLSPPGKLLTPNELADIRGHGLDLALVWENRTGDALEGYDAGVQYGRRALARAASLGYPDDCAIYFAIDFNVQPVDLEVVTAYIAGISENVPWQRIGAYGGLRVISYLFDRSLISWGWQTYGWSNEIWDPRAHVHQYSNNVTVAGAQCDLNTSTSDHFGQWRTDPMPGFDDTANAHLIATDTRVREILLKGSEVYDDVPGEGPAQRPWLVAQILQLHRDLVALQESVTTGGDVWLRDDQLDALAGKVVDRITRELERGQFSTYYTGAARPPQPPDAGQ